MDCCVVLQEAGGNGWVHVLVLSRSQWQYAHLKFQSQWQWHIRNFSNCDSQIPNCYAWHSTATATDFATQKNNETRKLGIRNSQIRFSLRFYIKWYIKTTWCVPGDDRHLSPWYSHALSHSGNTFPPSLFGCLSPHKVMWAFPAFLLSNKIRVKYVLGVFDPVHSEYDIGFSQFPTG